MKLDLYQRSRAVPFSSDNGGMTDAEKAELEAVMFRWCAYWWFYRRDPELFDKVEIA